MNRVESATHRVVEFRHGHRVVVATSHTNIGADTVAAGFKAAGRDVWVETVDHTATPAWMTEAA